MIVHITIATPAPQNPPLDPSLIRPLVTPPLANALNRRNPDDAPQCAGLRGSAEMARVLAGRLQTILGEEPLNLVDTRCEDERTVANYCEWWDIWGNHQQPYIVRQYCTANELCVRTGKGRTAVAWCAAVASAEQWDVDGTGPSKKSIYVELPDGVANDIIHVANMYYNNDTGSPLSVGNTTFVSTRDGQPRGQVLNDVEAESENAILRNHDGFDMFVTPNAGSGTIHVLSWLLGLPS